MQQFNAAKDTVLADIRALTSAATSPAESLDEAMAYLHTYRPDYHWVGIYRLEQDTLILGPYRGPATDHTRIPVGRGVCGTAVVENRNQIVADVGAVSNYLACNLSTRSEMVVLIRHPQDGQILGQIDVDGTKLNQFDAAEEQLIEAVGQILAPYLMKYVETLAQ